MRGTRIGLLDHLGGGSQRAAPRQQAGGQRRRRYEIGRAFGGRRRKFQRALGVGELALLGDRRFQHGAFALRGRRVDRLGPRIGFDGRKRAFPVGLRGLLRNHGLARPRQRGDAMRLAREMIRGIVVAAPLRLDVQAAQTQKFRLFALGHGGEGRLGGHTIAIELRDLRIEQHRQRLARQMARRLIRRLARGPRIARARSHHATRQRVIALATTTRVARIVENGRHAEDQPQRAPKNRENDSGRQHRANRAEQ